MTRALDGEGVFDVKIGSEEDPVDLDEDVEKPEEEIAQIPQQAPSVDGTKKKRTEETSRSICYFINGYCWSAIFGEGLQKWNNWKFQQGAWNNSSK